MNLEDLGWGEPFASAFAASDVDGGAPARVIAVHRGHLVVAGAQGEAARRRRRAGARARDDRRLGRRRRPRRRQRPAAPPRRAGARRPGPGRQRRRRLRRHLRQPRPQRRAAWSASSPWPPPAAARRCSCSTRPISWPIPSPTLAVLRAVAPGVPGGGDQRAARRRRRRAHRAARPRPHGRADRLVGRGQVDADQRAAGQRATRPPRRSARTTTAGATRPRAGSSSPCRTASAC